LAKRYFRGSRAVLVEQLQSILKQDEKVEKPKRFLRGGGQQLITLALFIALIPLVESFVPADYKATVFGTLFFVLFIVFWFWSQKHKEPSSDLDIDESKALIALHILQGLQGDDQELELETELDYDRVSGDRVWMNLDGYELDGVSLKIVVAAQVFISNINRSTKKNRRVTHSVERRETLKVQLLGPETEKIDSIKKNLSQVYPDLAIDGSILQFKTPARDEIQQDLDLHGSGSFWVEHPEILAKALESLHEAAKP
jgi:hypothetical protein